MRPCCRLLAMSSTTLCMSCKLGCLARAGSNDIERRSACASAIAVPLGIRRAAACLDRARVVRADTCICSSRHCCRAALGWPATRGTGGTGGPAVARRGWLLGRGGAWLGAPALCVSCAGWLSTDPCPCCPPLPPPCQAPSRASFGGEEVAGGCGAATWLIGCLNRPRSWCSIRAVGRRLAWSGANAVDALGAAGRVCTRDALLAGGGTAGGRMRSCVCACLTSCGAAGCRVASWTAGCVLSAWLATAAW
ncbi:hypothetical protein V8C86DRAFT_2449705 [Haematococcus lacustris]